MPGMGNHTGTLVKPHGYKGEMLLRGKPGILQNLTEGMPLFIAIDGQRVPFFIEEVHNDDPAGKVVVKFEFIDSREAAGRYVSCEVYSESGASVRTGEEPKLDDYMGFLCTDRSSGAELTVTGYIDSAENPILVLEYKGSEVLLPANADYILEVDRKAGTIEAEFPAGLLDLE